MITLLATAPSNIALIKYMGKIEGGGNRPTNSSLSWTLNHLKTFVRLTRLPDQVGVDEWRALEGDSLSPFRLSEKGRQKFLQHFDFLKSRLGLTDSFLVESANNFPSDCGLASSASSFAALTRAAHEMALQLKTIPAPLAPAELAELSRKGSGSSSRSFFSPWALWTATEVRPLDLGFDQLHHQVFVVESGKKSVSSSEAHVRVLTSELFPGRPERAEKRLHDLTGALRAQNWTEAFEICWAEFWDMHALFETSRPAFGYMEPKTLQVLKVLRQGWLERGDGPLVTMDAGANIHALYRMEQKALAFKIRDQLKDQALILMSDTLTESP
jgi:diphosphomevalonate decarboxylase